MDFNEVLTGSLLLYGRYDTKQVHRREWRVWMNYVMAIVQFIVGAKLWIILLYPWNDERPILLYLVHFYVINSPVQRLFYVGCAGLHFGLCRMYLKWGRLSSDPQRMYHLRMFFMNFWELCAEFDLDIRLTRRFLRRANWENWEKRAMYVIAVGAAAICVLLTIFCIIESYRRLPFEHFLFIACPLATITLLNYIVFPFPILGTLLMALLTMEFLVLRANCLAEKITSKFCRLTRYANVKRDTVTLLKRRKQLMKILQTLNDIVEQFEATNHIFDGMLSINFTSLLFGALIYLVFFFLELTPIMQFLLFLLYFIGFFVNCCVISIYNDSFLSKMKVLDSAIHHTMVMHQAFDVKMNLGNYLTLNGEHKRLSFTFLRSFDYSTNNLIVQAIWSGSSNSNGILSNF